MFCSLLVAVVFQSELASLDGVLVVSGDVAVEFIVHALNKNSVARPCQTNIKLIRRKKILLT